MSYTLVIEHIQKILNQCNDPVNLIPTGRQTMSETGDMSIEIEKALIMKQNMCCSILPPSSICSDNPEDKYLINRIRISKRLANDYSQGFFLTDKQMKDVISEKTLLFDYYPKY
ncbi:hypothetical protein [Chryseobacterium sp. KCF3-3]|uniref:hypothetical protein n=1 Tax=Chryseobacterium sp. KCF3-3 TaxID=3231511 RepID=UPI0038B26998